MRPLPPSCTRTTPSQRRRFRGTCDSTHEKSRLRGSARALCITRRDYVGEATDARTQCCEVPRSDFLSPPVRTPIVHNRRLGSLILPPFSPLAPTASMAARKPAAGSNSFDYKVLVVTLGKYAALLLALPRLAGLCSPGCLLARHAYPRASSGASSRRLSRRSAVRRQRGLLDHREDAYSRRSPPLGEDSRSRWNSHQGGDLGHRYASRPVPSQYLPTPLAGAEQVPISAPAPPSALN